MATSFACLPSAWYELPMQILNTGREAARPKEAVCFRPSGPVFGRNPTPVLRGTARVPMLDSCHFPTPDRGHEMCPHAAGFVPCAEGKWDFPLHSCVRPVEEIACQKRGKHAF